MGEKSEGSDDDIDDDYLIDVEDVPDAPRATK
jgi:hypothetical protein